MKKIWEYFLQAIRGDETEFTTGSVNRALFLLSVPMILEMVMESLFAVVDIFFISQLGSENAIAAIGLTEAFMFVIMSIALGINSATIALVGRRIGEKENEAACFTAVQAMIYSLVIGLVLGLIGYYFAGELLSMMGASEAVVHEGLAYAQIILLFNVLMIFLYVNNAVFRGSGDASNAMKTLWIANGINIILDPCLIFGLGPFPELGLKGAAIASCIGRSIGVLYQFYYLTNGKSILKIAKKHLVANWEILKGLIKISIGGAGQHLLTTASWIVLVRIIAEFGSEALAGYTIAMRIVMFTLLPSWGLAMAVSTLVSQNLGANQADRAEKSVWIAARYNMYFLVLLSISFLFFAHPVISIFSDHAEVIKNGVLCIQIVCAGYIFYAYEMILGQAFNGAGDTYTPTLLNFIAFWIIEMPLAYVLAVILGFGPTGAYIAIAISSSILAIMAIVIFRKGKWKQVVV